MIMHMLPFSGGIKRSCLKLMFLCEQEQGENLYAYTGVHLENFSRGGAIAKYREIRRGNGLIWDENLINC